MKKNMYRVWSGNMWLDGSDANIHAVDLEETNIELKASYPHTNLIMCLWTGLLDKYKKKVYEGDIVKLGIKKSIVQWTDEVAGFDLYDLIPPRTNYPIRNIDKTAKLEKGHWERHIWNGLSEYEIIGNIYENPELLET